MVVAPLKFGAIGVALIIIAVLSFLHFGVVCWRARMGFRYDSRADMPRSVKLCDVFHWLHVAAALLVAVIVTARSPLALYLEETASLQLSGVLLNSTSVAALKAAVIRGKPSITYSPGHADCSWYIEDSHKGEDAYCLDDGISGSYYHCLSNEVLDVNPRCSEPLAIAHRTTMAAAWLTVLLSFGEAVLLWAASGRLGRCRRFCLAAFRRCPCSTFRCTLPRIPAVLDRLRFSILSTANAVFLAVIAIWVASSAPSVPSDTPCATSWGYISAGVCGSSTALVFVSSQYPLPQDGTTVGTVVVSLVATAFFAATWFWFCDRQSSKYISVVIVAPIVAMVCIPYGSWLFFEGMERGPALFFYNQTYVRLSNVPYDDPVSLRDIKQNLVASPTLQRLADAAAPAPCTFAAVSEFQTNDSFCASTLENWSNANTLGRIYYTRCLDKTTVHVRKPCQVMETYYYICLGADAVIGGVPACLLTIIVSAYCMLSCERPRGRCCSASLHRSSFQAAHSHVAGSNGLNAKLSID